jgi:Ran GTPase-activating protein (RanGAP) involved in mRNA processing and transport
MVLAVASARSVGATAGRGEYRRRRQQLARKMPEISGWKLRNMVDRTRFAHDDGLVKDTMTSGNVRDRVEEKKEKEEKKEEEDEEEKEEEEEEEEEEEDEI